MIGIVPLPSRAIADARGLAHQLVKRGIDIIGKLDFGHGAQAISRHADRNADDPAFGDRRIKTRVLPYFCLQASGRAEHAAEIADILAKHDHVRHRRAMATSMALLIASIMFMRPHEPMALAPAAICASFRPCIWRDLFAQMPGHFFEHILKHRVERLVQAVAQDAVLFRFFLRRFDQFGEFKVHGGVPLLVPFAECDQMRFQPRDGIAQRPVRGFIGGAIGARIIGRAECPSAR